MRILSITIFMLFFISCDQTTSFKKEDFDTNIIPQPKMIDKGSGVLLLSGQSKLYSPQSDVYPLLDLFISEINKITNIELGTTDTNNHEADILFQIDASMIGEEYSIEIGNTINVIGGNYKALAKAKSTLLQLLGKEEGKLMFPIVTIKDNPNASYRGLLVDLARQWHEIHTIKKLIDLAAYYKINYLQLHFTDYQSYTLPSTKYKNLSTPNRHYTFEQLKELEAYSQLRGITIIPEIDIPGHSSQFVRKYPEIFAIKDTVTNPWIINMGKEDAYEALDFIIGEISSIFEASPYFHIGGDEAIFDKVSEDPFVQNYIKTHQIDNDVHELYRHFLVRMNGIVKKHHKQMCVWEGFRPNGKIKIPKDIIVFEFETNRYLPNELIKDGYTVVNTSWKPLYVVNEKKWEPKTIYAWNMWKWDNWYDKAPSYNPIQMEKSPLVIGAQMCSWEQSEKVEIPSLRKRLPVYMERVWNTDKKIPFEEVMNHIDILDDRLSKLINDNEQDSLLHGHNFTKDTQ
ncbi:family 20 glycosylhydrolase [Maribacter sp. ANRC-HE7]|uniref:beta-N-acetylhexosaminidase n=1 Tax=Maribacter aquimaris TaxID=2737171 RepID=A0ABR7V1K2_9FLAO|nr:family 20 glycosylhydrolase [Maribacter aquimaris]MBD0778648.1 family 20 glycosylhydrolase [Maribacter aquimaris]